MSEDIATRNRVRLLLTTFFQHRDCACLPRPLVDEASLAALHQPGCQTPLRPAFVDALRSVSEVVTQAQPKTLNGLALSGAQLARMVVCYVEALNAGQVPTVSARRIEQAFARHICLLAARARRLGPVGEH